MMVVKDIISGVLSSFLSVICRFLKWHVMKCDVCSSFVGSCRLPAFVSMQTTYTSHILSSIAPLSI